MAERFLSSIKPRPDFAKDVVKVLHLRPAVSPERGASILRLCQGLQELSLQIAANLPDAENPLLPPLRGFKSGLTTLRMDLASAFYDPHVFLPTFTLLQRVKRLHLSNTWVARRGLHIGLHDLSQLTHLSFHSRPPGLHTTRIEVVLLILQRLPRLRVLVLWRMDYHTSQEIYAWLIQHRVMDRRIIVFNSIFFTEFTEPVSSFWEAAEQVVRWRENNEGMLLLFCWVLVKLINT